MAVGFARGDVVGDVLGVPPDAGEKSDDMA
jgi:hypothetical protein